MAIVLCACNRQPVIEDGQYAVDMTMEGGIGKAYIESPALVTVEGDSVKLQLVWSSKNYDYMIVDGVKYLNETEGEPSTFTIELGSVSKLGEELLVIGDTTAMSTPHEIEYTLRFGDLKKYE